MHVVCCRASAAVIGSHFVGNTLQALLPSFTSFLRPQITDPGRATVTRKVGE
jgi:hypothetical protein